MKIVEEKILISRGSFANSDRWKEISNSVRTAVCGVEWPPGSGTGEFIVNPKRKGNGVKPIKEGLISELRANGWNIEHPFEEPDDRDRPAEKIAKPGDFDAVLQENGRSIAVEWETGNISSSHRALNKMALGLKRGLLAAGTLIVPSKAFYPYLTDRVGNVSELRPYFELYESISVDEGVLEIIVIEHDGVDTAVPLIKKGTDGRAKG